MVSVSVLNYTITFLCIIGLGLSIYAYVVELKAERNDKYRAMCDISERMSCTKAFKSKYGKGFGLVPEGSFLHQPNSLLGILYYSLAATLAQANSKFITKFLYFAIILANFASLYFAYILYYILYDFCVVCVSTYIVNILSFVFTHFKLRQLTGKTTPIKKTN